MRKNLLFLGAISIVLIVAAVLAGIYYTADSEPATPVTSAVSTAQPAEELYSFGDDDKYSVLLNLAGAQLRPEGVVTLTAAGAHAVLPNESICTHTGVHVTVPPAGVTQGSPVHDIGTASSVWLRLVDWFEAPFQDQYAITLWVPDYSYNSFELVSGDAPVSPVVCFQQAGEDV